MTTDEAIQAAFDTWTEQAIPGAGDAERELAAWIWECAAWETLALAGLNRPARELASAVAS